MFNPSRLRLARKRRGMTKVQLAKASSLNVQSLIRYESGIWVPSDTTIDAIAGALSFPAGFFHGDDMGEPSPEAVSLRAYTTLSASRRDAALGAAAIAFEFSAWIDERFDLASCDVPDAHGHDPETAAQLVRDKWALGEKPIRNMVHLLESVGVRVFSLAEECADLNAFCAWYEQRPFVFLNTMKSGESSRFDAAHELGHLVLHRQGGPRGGREAERQADAFASSFLMTRGSVVASAPRFPTVESLIALKQKWGVSVAALAHRLGELRLVTDWHLRMLWVEISRRGYRSSEPQGIKRETSQLLQKVFAALREDKVTTEDIATQLRVNADEINKLVFGLAVAPAPDAGGVDIDTTERREGKPQLRLIKR